jgi:hypothetical protein
MLDGSDSPLPAPTTLDVLVDAQKKRLFAIKGRLRCDRQCESYIVMQWDYDVNLREMTSAERKRLFARAQDIRTAVEKRLSRSPQCEQCHQPKVNPLADEGLGAEFAPIIHASMKAKLVWDSTEESAEREMRRIARSLPIWEWAKDISGLGDLSVARILACAKYDLARFRRKEMLWKRLCLAVIDGIRQQKKTDLELAAKHGYSPPRRAEMWSVADSLLRHQWRGEKDGVPAHAIGPYGEVYARRKQATADRGWTAKHRDDDARRYMMKVLVRDLWRKWQELAGDGTDEIGRARPA